MDYPMQTVNSQLFGFLDWAYYLYRQSPMSSPIGRQLWRDLVIEIMIKLNSVDLDETTMNHLVNFVDTVRAQNRPLFEQIKVVFQNWSVREPGSPEKSNVALFELFVSAYERLCHSFFSYNKHKGALFNLLSRLTSLDLDPVTAAKLQGFRNAILPIKPRLLAEMTPILRRYT